MTYKDAEKNRIKGLLKQILCFGIVGGLSTGIDFGFFVFLTEVIGVSYYIANILSFLISLMVNYILSMRFVFEAKGNQSRETEIFVFFLLSVIGLVINQVILVFLTKGLDIYYIISKVIATAVVMIWNFTSKKIYFECCNP